MNRAWHLRQDGEYFPIDVHLYPMQDEDLSSEAEVASFIVSTKSKDLELAEYVIDSWLALQIEDKVDYDANSDDIDAAIESRLGSLPYSFAYPLSVNEYISIHHKQGNYNDVDSLYEFTDNVRDNLSSIQEDIFQSFNQQFCRVRFGGKYNSKKGDGGIWFRIASVNYNWADTIYVFVSNMKNKLGIDTVTVCRDPESDYGYGMDGEDYFYKAKDGEVYYQMPIEEYLQEEHEHSVVFSSVDLGGGVYSTMRRLLSVQGNTFLKVRQHLSNNGIIVPHKTWSYFVKCEQRMCVESSEWTDNLNTRTKYKISKVERMILSEFSEISDIDVDYRPRENTKGNMVGFELIFTLKSNIEEIDNLEISVASTKPLGSSLAESIVRMFRIEYTSYLKFKQIKIQ